jgi:hypothetical protein
MWQHLSAMTLGAEAGTKINGPYLGAMDLGRRSMRGGGGPRPWILAPTPYIPVLLPLSLQVTLLRSPPTDLASHAPSHPRRPRHQLCPPLAPAALPTPPAGFAALVAPGWPPYPQSSLTSESASLNEVLN